MRRISVAVIAMCFSIMAPSVGFAGATERACLASNRSPGPQVCRCAQTLADQILSTRDQREAARIIADPDRFRTVRKRQTAASKAFIERYRNWGELTQEYCG